jgi:CheY-like chemotaxis protein
MNNQDVKSWTILIVDDEPDNREIAQRILSFYGATVVTAINGQDGLDQLASMQSIPTLILLDISMPLMNGFDMLKAIRAQTIYDKVPVIALTAHVLPADIERIREAGFNGFIGKPFAIGTLLQNLRTALTNALQA